MGTYVYNMRKATVPAIINGSKVKLNFYSYSYKEWWSMCWGKEQQRREFIAMRAQQVGDDAFASPRSGYVVMADPKRDKDELEGAPVYNEVTRGVWVDTCPFPGKLVGWLQREGNKWVVRPYGKWGKWSRWSEEQKGFVDFITRSVLHPDGTVTDEEKKPVAV